MTPQQPARFEGGPLDGEIRLVDANKPPNTYDPQISGSSLHDAPEYVYRLAEQERGRVHYIWDGAA